MFLVIICVYIKHLEVYEALSSLSWTERLNDFSNTTWWTRTEHKELTIKNIIWKSPRESGDFRCWMERCPVPRQCQSTTAFLSSRFWQGLPLFHKLKIGPPVKEIQMLKRTNSLDSRALTKGIQNRNNFGLWENRTTLLTKRPATSAGHILTMLEQQPECLIFTN